MWSTIGTKIPHQCSCFEQEISENGILPRWTVEAKAGRVLDDLGAARGKEICDGSMLERRHRLFQIFSEIVDDAILSLHGTQFVELHLEVCKMKVCTNPTPREERAFSGIQVPISIGTQPSVKEPLQVRAKGCGKRLKGGKEKAMGKVLRKCTFCGKKGQNHDKRNCPLRSSQGGELDSQELVQDGGMYSQDVGMHDEDTEVVSGWA